MRISNNAVYHLTLPSTNEKVKFRPYTVGEEKVLLLAKSTEDPAVMIDAIKQLIAECTYGKVDPNQIPYFDFQHVYAMLRAKSVGEQIELQGGCECSTEAKTDTLIDIEQPLYNGTIRNKKELIVKIPEAPDGWGVVLRYPNIDLAQVIVDVQKAGTLEAHMPSIISSCIDMIFNDDTAFDDETPESKLEFVESLAPKQKKELINFINTLPLQYYEAQYKCIKCGKDHNVKVQGLERFFV